MGAADGVFNELLATCQKKAEKKVSEELRRLRSRVKRLDPLEKNFRVEVRKAEIAAEKRYEARRKTLKAREDKLRKREQDLRLAEGRVKKVLKEIDRISKLTISNAVTNVVFKEINGYSRFYAGNLTSKAVSRLKRKKI